MIPCDVEYELVDSTTNMGYKVLGTFRTLEFMKWNNIYRHQVYCISLYVPQRY